MECGVVKELGRAKKKGRWQAWRKKREKMFVDKSTVFLNIQKDPINAWLNWAQINALNNNRRI